MKRKICLMLTLLLLLIPGVAKADSTGILHVAVNDKLYDLSVRPAFLGTPIIIYLPYGPYGDLGIEFSYDYETGIATVSSGSASVDFDMADDGQAYDALGSPLTGVNAQFINGQIYLPVPFICDLFGMSYSLIPGVGYGDIIRITNGDSLLDDKTFLAAYTFTMRERWYALQGQTTPSPSPSATPSPDIDRSDISIYMSFSGLPTDEVIAQLDRYGIKSCFFLTADEVLHDPEAVRKLIIIGHDVGVLCGVNALEDYTETSTLIFEAANRVALHVGSLDESASAWALAETAPLVYSDFDIDAGTVNISALALLLEAVEDSAHIRFSAIDEQTPSVLDSLFGYLINRKYDLQDYPLIG